MKTIINTVLSLALMISVVSCMSDIDPGEGIPHHGDENVDIRLNLRTPGGFATPQTRSLSYADENTLSNVYVLVFDNDSPSKLASIKKADQVTDKTTGSGAMTSPAGDYSGGGAFSVILTPSSGSGINASSNLVVLANAEEILHARGFIDKANPATASPKIGEIYDTVIAAIYGEITGAMYPAASGETIPMWGETGQIAITSSAKPDVKLMRAVARIDVGLGDEPNYDADVDPAYTWDGKDTAGVAIPFKMTSVYVVRANNAYSVVPATANRSGVLVTEPSVPASSIQFPATDDTEAKAFTYTVSNNLYTTQNIYVPEADIRMGGTESGDANHTDRMAIVVGGEYDGSGETTYYRLDFANDGTLMDVLRNHLYRFNISAVSCEGYASVIEAYESHAMNMEAKILDLDETEMEYMVFDGSYYLGVSEPDVFLDGEGDTVTVNIRTNAPAFTMNIGGGAVELISDDGAKKTYTVNGITYTISDPVGDTYTLTIVAGKSVSHINDRIHDWTITAKRLTMPFKATHLRYVIAPLAAPGVIGYIAGTTTLTLKGSKEYAANPGINQYAIDNFGGLETETVYVAYFQFGSLIALSADGSDTKFPYFESDDILAGPSEWIGYLKLKGNPTWDGIPRFGGREDWIYQDNGEYSKRNVSHSDYHDPSTGKGDPCIYYFGNQYGGGWRLPVGGASDADINTPNAIANGGWNAGTFGTGTMGTNIGLTGAHATWLSIDDGRTAGVPAGMLAGDGSGGHPLDWTMYLPAAGYRHYADGSMRGQSDRGYYWSSTASSNGDNGHGLTFGSIGVTPATNSYSSYGFPVRCVQDE